MFVSRKAHEDALAGAEEAHAALGRGTEHALMLIAALTDRVAFLEGLLQGRASAAPAALAHEPVPALSKEVEAECRRWANRNVRQHAKNRQFALDLAAQGKRDDAIIQALREGERVEFVG